jgi:hypothetical protein
MGDIYTPDRLVTLAYILTGLMLQVAGKTLWQFEPWAHTPN